MTQRCSGRSISFQVMLDSCVSVAYIMFVSRRLKIWANTDEKAHAPKGRSGPKIGMLGGRLDATIQLSWRETVEGSLSHGRSAGRVRIGVALAETAETSRTVPLSARSRPWCAAQLIGVTLAEIAEIHRGVQAVSAHGRRPCISGRACAQDSACNILFQPECNRVP
jgi:hypothetical protein